MYAFILTRSSFGLLHIIFRTFVPEFWPSCEDPGIFVKGGGGGGGGVHVNLTKKSLDVFVFCFFFYSPQPILQKSND